MQAMTVPRWRERVLWPAFSRVRSVGWAAIDQGVVSAANFLSIFLLTRNLATADFGAFMLAHTGLLLLTSVQSALVTQPHNVLAAALPRAEYRPFTGALLRMQLLMGASLCGVIAAAGLVVRFHAPGAGDILLALAAAAFPWMGQEFVRRVLYTRGESRAAAINDWVTYGLQLGGTFALVFFLPGHATPITALGVFGASSLAGLAMGFWQLREHVSLDMGGGAGARRKVWREVWQFGRWLTAQNLLVWFGSQGHSWVVGLMLGVEQVGIYRAVTHLINVLNPLRQTVYSYFPSRGARAYHAGGATGLERWVRRVTWVLPLVLLPPCLVLVAFPSWILELAYGDKYIGADLALILSLATIAQCMTFLKFPFDLGLLALRATKSIFYIYLIPVLLLSTTGVLAIHYFGLLGVPWSALIINAALLFATWVAYTRKVGASVQRERETQNAKVVDNGGERS